MEVVRLIDKYADRLTVLIDDLSKVSDEIRQLSYEPQMEVWAVELASALHNVRHGGINLSEIRKDLREIGIRVDLATPELALTEKGKSRVQDGGESH
jgi:hypothetical protein